MRKTAELFSQFRKVASSVKRLRFYGFYAPGTDRQIFSLLGNCAKLQSITLPWTTLRHVSAEGWALLLSGKSRLPLDSLELLSVHLTEEEAEDVGSAVNVSPLKSPLVDFSYLSKLDMFGDATLMPITDEDVRAIARTATKLRELRINCVSSVTIEGVVAVMQSSRSTLQIIEFRPHSDGDYDRRATEPTCHGTHLCEFLATLPRLETISLSIPFVCTQLFTNESVRWAGDCRFRAASLCRPEGGDCAQTPRARLRTLLDHARSLITARAHGSLPSRLSVQLSLGGCIFEPGILLVHGRPRSKSIPGFQWLESNQAYREVDEANLNIISEHDFFAGTW